MTCQEEPPDERTVWRTEAAAICVALGVLAIAFGVYLVLSWLLPDGADWTARAGSAAMGFWLATRAYRRVLRSQGFASSGLGVRSGAPPNPDLVAEEPSICGPALKCGWRRNDRTHLDLWVDTKEEQLAEVDRLIALGAARVDWRYPDDADFVVLADPGGTLFCVIDLSK